MRNWATRLCAAALIAAGPVWATPPQVVTVEDALFARNADTLFLLRTITDNHGLHMVRQTDTLLIHRSLAGGDDRGFRGVARVIDFGPDGAPRVETLPLQDPANPYDLFAGADAWPLGVGRIALPGEALATLDRTGLEYRPNPAIPSGPAYRLSAEDLAARIEDTLRAGRQILPPHALGGGSTGADAFDPAAFDPEADCRPDAAMRLFHADTDPALVRLTCEDEESGQRATLWLVVPQL